MTCRKHDVAASNAPCGPSRETKPTMKSFLLDRGLSLAAVVLILFVASLAQASISYTIGFGELRSLQRDDILPITTALVTLRFGLIAILVALWALKRKRTLFRGIVVVNALFTLALLGHANALLGVLFGSVAHAVDTLLLDVVLMAVSNILIFSIWYWIIDPPGVDESPRENEPWEFLFPQRGSGLPHYESWVPGYTDYLFIAFTTSFAFSPTDALPLTRRAKMLMLLQAAMSIVTLTGIAGSAINILAGRG